MERWVIREAGESLKDPGDGKRQACMHQPIVFNVTFL